MVFLIIKELIKKKNTLETQKGGGAKGMDSYEAEMQMQLYNTETNLIQEEEGGN